MNTINGTSGNNHQGIVQQATKRNTLTQVADAKQSGIPVDVEQIQSSNQELRNTARETGVALYSQQLQKKTFETYANVSNNNSSTTSSDENKSSNDIYNFDASKVNDALQTVQRRSFAVAAYENQDKNQNNQPNQPELDTPSTQPVNIFV